MLADYLSRQGQPIKYAAPPGVSTAFDTFMHMQTRAHDLPRLLDKRKIQLHLGQPLLGLLQTTVGGEDRVAPHIMGDALAERDPERSASNIMGRIRQFHSAVHPAVAGYNEADPAIYHHLLAWLQAANDPQHMRSIGTYLRPRRGILEHLADVAAEYNTDMPFEPYRMDRHSPEALAGMYDALHDVYRQFTPRRKPRSDSHMEFEYPGGGGTPNNTVPDLAYAGTRQGAYTGMRSLAEYLRTRILPRLPQIGGA